MIVVIDGPAGSGKSSTAKAVADKLDMQYIDSGAIYRVVSLLYIQSSRNQNKFFELLKSANISFHYEKGLFRVFLNDNEVTKDIRTPETSGMVSTVAAMPEVREIVTDYLREVVKDGSYISDGRDLGTVVYPDADLKIYMVADLDKRAERRFEELKTGNINVDFGSVRENLKKRDEIDSGRSTAPLKKAKNAIEIDTSELNFDEQVDLIIEHVNKIKSGIHIPNQ